MGELVAAAITAHQPAIMLPEEFRQLLGGGQDSSLIAGFAKMRAKLLELEVDTLIVIDTHWFSTNDHLLAGQSQFKGIYTSDELPQIIADYQYDYPGSPELASNIAAAAEGTVTRVSNITNPHMANHYPTINMVHYLRDSQKILPVSICQTAERHNYLDFGAMIAEGIKRTDERVAILASGGMSHSFCSMDTINDHLAFSPEFVVSEEARQFDEDLLGLMQKGDHQSVLDRYDEYRSFKPEGRFGHYLIMLGAMGGASAKYHGQLMSNYENAAGTGQVHIWFDL